MILPLPTNLACGIPLGGAGPLCVEPSSHVSSREPPRFCLLRKQGGFSCCAGTMCNTIVMIEFYGRARLESSLSVLWRQNDECDRRRASQALFVWRWGNILFLWPDALEVFTSRSPLAALVWMLVTPLCQPPAIWLCCYCSTNIAYEPSWTMSPSPPNFCLTAVAVTLFDWQTKWHEKTTTTNTTKKKTRSVAWQFDLTEALQTEYPPPPLHAPWHYIKLTRQKVVNKRREIRRMLTLRDEFRCKMIRNKCLCTQQAGGLS